MQAAVLEEYGKLAIREMPTPTPGPEEMLLRVRSCAVCGSDLRIFRHGNPRVKLPQVIGHEIAGEVEAVGPGLESFRPGDRVAVGADVPCGVCDFCRRGLGNNCPINYAIGYQFPGGFADRILLNATTIRYGPVHLIPQGLSFEEAALAEPLACCLNGLELSALAPGETVVVIGAGPVGGMLVRLARALGAARIILAQRSPGRLEMARRFGADALVATQQEDLVERVLQETGGQGADLVITACASPEAQQQAPLLARNRGRINFFGGLPKGAPAISLDSNLVHYKELFIHGSHGSVPRHHRAALGMIAHGQVKVSDLISHRFPLDRISEAFQAVESRAGMKVLVNP